MSDVKYRVISSVNEIESVSELRRELVILPEVRVKNPDGKGTVAAAFWQYELDTGEHGEYDISDREFDENGNVVKIKRGGRDVAFLAFTTRDGDGQRVFHTIAAAEATLKRWGKSVTNRMLIAAQKANYGDGDVTNADEAEKRAEGNSEETSTSS